MDWSLPSRSLLKNKLFSKLSVKRLVSEAGKGERNGTLNSSLDKSFGSCSEERVTATITLILIIIIYKKTVLTAVAACILSPLPCQVRCSNAVLLPPSILRTVQ